MAYVSDLVSDIGLSIPGWLSIAEVYQNWHYHLVCLNKAEQGLGHYPTNPAAGCRRYTRIMDPPYPSPPVYWQWGFTIMFYFAAPVIVGLFALAATVVGIRGTSVGQHIGAAFFICGSSGFGTAFIMDYFQTNYAGGVVYGALVSTLGTWLIAYLLVSLIYVADEKQSTAFATTVTIVFGTGALIFVLSTP